MANCEVLNRKRDVECGDEAAIAAGGRLAIVVHAEAHFELFELLDEPLGGRVDVLGLGDELHVLAAVEMGCR